MCALCALLKAQLVRLHPHTPTPKPLTFPAITHMNDTFHITHTLTYTGDEARPVPVCEAEPRVAVHPGHERAHRPPVLAVQARPRPTGVESGGAGGVGWREQGGQVNFLLAYIRMAMQQGTRWVCNDLMYVGGMVGIGV